MIYYIVLEFALEVVIMTNQPTGSLKRIYGIVLSAALVFTGICLMVQCCRIYFTGDGTYSPEIVAAHFSPIAIPVYLCLLLIAAGFVLELILPKGSKKQPVEKNYDLILEKLHAKTDLAACDESLRSAVAKEQTARKRHKIVSIALLLTCSLSFLGFALDGNNFPQREITESLIRAMYLLVPCCCIPFGYAVFAANHRKASILREIELLKSAGANRTPVLGKTKDYDKVTTASRWVILAVAVGILVYGYLAGGTADVLTKAINICTECVGLG